VPGLAEVEDKAASSLQLRLCRPHRLGNGKVAGLLEGVFDESTSWTDPPTIATLYRRSHGRPKLP